MQISCRINKNNGLWNFSKNSVKKTDMFDKERWLLFHFEDQEHPGADKILSRHFL